MSNTPMFFWLASNKADWVTDDLLRRMGERAKLVVLNTEQTEIGNRIEFFKRSAPQVPILRYSKTHRHANQLSTGGSAWPVVSDPIHADWWLLNASGEIAGDNEEDEDEKGTLYTDVTNSAYRDFIVDHLRCELAVSGADGIAIDSFHATMNLYPRRRWKTSSKCAEELTAAWPAKCRSLLRELRQALPAGKRILINGLWSHRGTLEDGAARIQNQAAMLLYCDGALVEFWGHSSGTEANDDFARFVSLPADIFRPSRIRAGRTFLVAGRHQFDAWIDYRDDLEEARYTLSCYLLYSQTGTLFRYGQHFQLSRLRQARSGGFERYSDIDLDIGRPIGRPSKTKLGGLFRRYEHGTVFVAPSSSGTKLFRMNEDHYHTNGNRAKVPARSMLAVPGGHAQILTKAQLREPPALLVIELDPNASEWLVQDIRSWYRYRNLILCVESSDPGSAVIVRLEVDDKQRQIPRAFAILDILPVSGTYAVGNRDHAYGQERNLEQPAATHRTCSYRYPTDQPCLDFSISLDDEMAPLIPWRIVSIGVHRQVVIKKIVLSNPVHL
jgi:hypothetical protein